MSVEMESLSSILGDTFGKGEQQDTTPPVVEQKEVTPPVETVETPEAKEAKARDEAGRFAPKVETKVEPKVEKAPLQPADVAAIIDERRKRQELERQLAVLKSGQPKPDIWENPEAFVDSKLQSFVDPLRTEMLNLQVENARLKNPDFDEAMMAFLTAAQKDPNLSALADSSPNPLAFIFREGKRIKELGPYDGDMDKRDQAKFGELQGEVAKRDQQIAAMQAQLDQLTKSQAELAAVPRSLNNMSGASPKLADADPDDLSKIVRFK